MQRPTRSATTPVRALRPAAPLLQRRCACGNHTVSGTACTRCAEAAPRQSTALAVGASNDPLEQEADRLAEQVLAPRTAASVAPARPAVRRSAAASAAMQAPASVARVLAGPGQTLEPGVRADMERSFGQDFSGVRVHADGQAAGSARDIGALAYTAGEHIVFGGSRYAPTAPNGRRLLAHELAHVVQQRGGGTAALVQRETTPERQALAPQTLCEGKQDITEDIHDLYRDLDTLLASAPDIDAQQRRQLKVFFGEFFRNEGPARPAAFSFVSCTGVHLDLLSGRGERAEAYFDPEHSELGLRQDNADLIHRFRRDRKAEDLSKLLQLLMHEKRHVALGRSLQVAESNLKPGRSLSAATQAEYRAQEILATAEEIAVGRLSLGSSYAVEPEVQRKLYVLRNMIRGWVTDAEYQRLRGIIIAKLRERYGFDGGCDTSLTLGVVYAMEHNDWFVCDREHGGVLTPIPEGLHVCSDRTRGFCRAPGG